MDSGGGAEWFPDRRPSRRIVLILVAWVVLVHLVGVTNRWWPTADSAVYLGLGRSLAEGEGYLFNGSFCNSFTPGLPLAIAALRIVCGAGFWAPNLFIVLCGLAALVLIYLVMSRVGGCYVGFCVAAATALSYVFYSNAHRILTDIPFMALFWAVLYCMLRYQRGRVWWLIAGGLLAAACIAVRAPGLLVMGPVAIGMWADRSRATRGARRLIGAGAILGGAIAGGGAFLIAARRASERAPQYTKILLRSLDSEAGGRVQHLVEGLMELPSTFAVIFTSQEAAVLNQLGAVLLVVALLGAVSLWRRGVRLIPTVVVLYPALLILLAGRFGAIRPRYLLPIQPMLIYAVMEGGCCCVKLVCKWKSKPAGGDLFARAVTILIALIVVFNAPRMLRNAFYYSYLAYTPRYYRVIRSGKYAELFELADLIRRRSPPAVRIGMVGKEGGILHFLSERRVVSLPRRRRKAATSPAPVARSAAARPDLRFFVFDLSRARSAFAEHLTSELTAADEFSVVFQGERFIAYERTGPPREGRQDQSRPAEPTLIR